MYMTDGPGVIRILENYNSLANGLSSYAGRVITIGKWFGFVSSKAGGLGIQANEYAQNTTVLFELTIYCLEICYEVVVEFSYTMNSN